MTDWILQTLVAVALSLGTAAVLGDLTDGAATRGHTPCGDYLEGTRREQEALCAAIRKADTGRERTHPTWTHDTDTGD